MKELSIEEKARRYDEAIKEAKEYHIDVLSLRQPVKDILEHIFPELFESENERVRKEIIDYLSTAEDKKLIPYESWIAWLENQGEQKPAEEYNITGISSNKSQGKLGEIIKNLKTTWSEEVSPYYDDICEILINLLHSETANINKNAVQKDLDWLTSLKDKVLPQPKQEWKPSSEQIIALRWVLNNIPYNKHKEEISGLLYQIKEL